jgi:hypothetical protein
MVDCGLWPTRKRLIAVIKNRRKISKACLMIALAILCALTGATLGLRFRVMVLLPIIVAILLAVAVAVLIARVGLWTAAIDAIVVTASLQLGYLGGAAIRLIIAAGRVPASRQPAAPHAQTVLKLVSPHSD